MWKQSPAPSAADHAAAPRTPLACTESHPLADPTCCNRRNQMQKELFLFTARRETFPLRQPSGNARGSAPAALPTGCSAQALPTSPREPGSCRRVRNMAGLRFLWSSPPPPSPSSHSLFSSHFSAACRAHGWMEQEQGTAPAPCRTWLVCMCAQHQNRHMCESHSEEVKSSSCTVLQMQKHVVGCSLLLLSKHFM